MDIKHNYMNKKMTLILCQKESERDNEKESVREIKQG